MEKKNPFLGPKSYEDGDAFFGRDAEIKEVINLIRNETLTLLFSRSGTGKSSLIKAGLIPLLRRNDEYLPIYIHLSDSSVNENSKDSLCDYVIRRCKEEINKRLVDKKYVKIVIPDLQNEHSLFEFIITVRLLQIEDSEVIYTIKPIIIFDQFEEIFTHSFPQAQLELLISEIRCLVESQLPDYFNFTPCEEFVEIQNSLSSKQKKFKVLFSFREEYLPQFESLRSEIPFIQFTNSRYRLEAFSKETAEAVILATDNDIKKSIAVQIAQNLAINILPNFKKIIVEPFLLSLVCQKIYYEIINEPEELIEKEIHKIRNLVNNCIDQYIIDVYACISENTREFIEIKLITSDHKRTPYNYNDAIAIPDLKGDINKLIEDPDFRLLNKEEFLDSPHIEILHDRLLPPLAKLRDDRVRKTENKKRNRILLLSLGAIIIICAISFFIYNQQRHDTEQMRMFVKTNQYFDKNDLRKAYGIYFKLDKNIDFINYINGRSNDLTYSDLPGSNTIALSNNHIISILDSSTTIEIWNVISATQIKLLKTYKGVSSFAISYNGNYLAMNDKGKLILYNSATDKNSVLLQNTTDDIGYEFSTNSNYIYCDYLDSICYVFDLKKQDNNISFYINERDRVRIKDIAFVSHNKIYSNVIINSSLKYFIGWNKRNDTLYIDNKARIYNSKINPWYYKQNDSLIFITSKGIEVKNLTTGKPTLLLKGNFSKFKFIANASLDNNGSSNNIILYSLTYYNKENRKYNKPKYAALGFFTIGEKSIYEPFENKLIDKIAISSDWRKCLIRHDNQNISLVDVKNRISSRVYYDSTKPETFLTDSIYDISDDGRYLLYAKQSVDSVNGKFGKNDTSATLYLSDLTKGTRTLIDPLSIDPNQVKRPGSIYGNYFFRFDPKSDMFAYLKKDENGSSVLTVRSLKDTAIRYNSSLSQSYVDDYRRLDFTSFYIHVKNMDANDAGESKKQIDVEINSNKRGIKLLDNEKRNNRYFSKLYPKMSKPEWNNETQTVNKYQNTIKKKR